MTDPTATPTVATTTTTTPAGATSGAGVIARYLRAAGVDRLFGVCGGHIMPIWMAAHEEGIRIIDVRDERSAVFMAHAHSAVSGGLGVALVTAGPGVTNAITGIANAHVARARVLVLSGQPPTAQAGRGALQDLPHLDLVRPITRYAATVHHPNLVVHHLNEAIASISAPGADPGPVYIDIPTDVLRSVVSGAARLPEFFRAAAAVAGVPDDDAVAAAAEVIAAAHRPLVITGRSARGAHDAVRDLLDVTGALYLDTAESRGVIPDDHPSAVTAARAQVMAEADLVVTIGRRLDFQVAYGSAAVFRSASFVRIGISAAEVSSNRRGRVEIVADVDRSLRALNRSLRAADRSSFDAQWAQARRTDHVRRAVALTEKMRNAPAGADGAMHPLTLVGALRDALPSDAIVVADGGDLLSFARVGLNPGMLLDPGSLGCLGVGTPFGIAASLASDRLVVVVTGDGALGFSAIELDTAARHHAPVMVVVANNGAWQIEVDDQSENFGQVVGTRLARSNYAGVASAFGLHAERIEAASDLPAAIARALEHRPSLLDVVVTSDARSADSMSGLARVPELQAVAAWDAAERALSEGAG